MVATIKDRREPAAMIALDDIDRAILRALAADATQSAGELGRALGLSQPADLAADQAAEGGGHTRRAAHRLWTPKRSASA